ncbi:hypothetical protein IFM89_031663, partial [Coptis chinensis]
MRKMMELREMAWQCGQWERCWVSGFNAWERLRGEMVDMSIVEYINSCVRHIRSLYSPSSIPVLAPQLLLRAADAIF